jgi:hypothetical protein
MSTNYSPYSEDVSTAEQHVLSGSITSELAQTGQIQYSSNQNLLSPRKIHPEQFIDNIANRYLI